MKKIVLVFILFLFSIQLIAQSKENSTSSGYASIDKLFTIILDDIKLSIIAYDTCSALYVDLDEIKKFVRIVNVDTVEYSVTSFKKDYSCYSFPLYSVKIVLDTKWYANIKPGSRYDTLTYLFLHDYHDYYKIFGFFTSDIVKLIKNNHESCFKNILRAMKLANILNAKEIRYYRMSVLKERNNIHWKVKKPCEYFKVYYDNPKKHINSILLREKPLQVPRVQGRIIRIEDEE